VDSDKSSCLFSICYSNQSISLFIKHTVTKPAAHEARPENGKCCVRKNESERERKRLEMSEREIKLYPLCVVCCSDYTEREKDIIIIRRVAILISRFYSAARGRVWLLFPIPPARKTAHEINYR
jgi:hypothetical protein